MKKKSPIELYTLEQLEDAVHEERKRIADASKTTELYKREFLHRVIIPHFSWRGSRMIFPYLWSGSMRHAVIELEDLLGIIKFDVHPFES